MRIHLFHLSLVLSVFPVVLSCSGAPTSARSISASDEARLNELWAEGQSSLAQLSKQWSEEGSRPIGGDVFSVSPSRFSFVAHDEPLSLQGEPVGGYLRRHPERSFLPADDGRRHPTRDGARGALRAGRPSMEVRVPPGLQVAHPRVSSS